MPQSALVEDACNRLSLMQIDMYKDAFFVRFDTKLIVMQGPLVHVSGLHRFLLAFRLSIRATSCTLCQPFLSHLIYNKMVNKSVTLECILCKDDTFELRLANTPYSSQLPSA